MAAVRAERDNARYLIYTLPSMDFATLSKLHRNHPSRTVSPAVGVLLVGLL
ncbi:MAG: hypothetical protein ABIR12_11120 [Ilumatobacteraceae bacterium]